MPSPLIPAAALALVAALSNSRTAAPELTPPILTPVHAAIHAPIHAALTSPEAEAAPQSDQEAVDDFEEYYGDLDSTIDRVEAVLTLEDNEAPGVVNALVKLLDADTVEVRDAAIRVLAGFETRPPIDRLVGAFADENGETERVALLEIMRKGAYQDLGEAVVEALEDRSWAIRRGAVLALGPTATTGTELAARLALLVDDPEVAVRCATIDALADARVREVLPLAQARLADDAWQVRASAIRATRLVRAKSSIPLLIARFDAEEGRLIEDLGKALDGITARDVGARPEAWKNFWERTGDRFEIPTDEEIVAWEKARKAEDAIYTAQNATSFHGIQTPSRAIVFVIDTSGSMESLVIERERYDPDAYPSWSRIDIVKTELARTIEGLEPYVKFGIISFATDTKRWKKKLVPANVINKRSALSFVEKLEPIGGNAQKDLAEVGLLPGADVSKGKTNTYGALALALGIDDDQTRSKPSRVDYLGEVDTIFFLSDGQPTFGKYILENKILERVKEANELRKVVLHTIAIGNFSKIFMAELARQNGGAFVDLGK